MKCIVVDDEPIARLGLVNYIKKIPSAHLTAALNDISSLQNALTDENPDVIFLDIQMPQITGIEFLKKRQDLPPTIIVTAYPEYALEGYELNVVDYLVKPVSFERFLKAYKKAEKVLEAGYSIPSGKKRDHLFIRATNRFERINFNDIKYIESMLNYVKIYTNTKVFITYSSLKGIDRELPDDQFLKVHKSYIVSVEKVTALQGSYIFLHDIKLPVSRNLKDTVYRKILNR